MIIGVDFDNTIVCYDQLFHQIAVEEGLIDACTPVSKTAVRDTLRAAGREQDWINLQGLVYGQRIVEAEAFPGVKKFFQSCIAQGHALFVVSHKTRLPVGGPQVSLHDAAMNWLEKQGFFDTQQSGMHRSQVFFETTKQGKLARIAQLSCDHFIDDLPEFLCEPAFPSTTKKWWFAPGHDDNHHAGLQRLSSWGDALDLFALQRITA